MEQVSPAKSGSASGGKKQRFVGTVVSDKMDKTVVVQTTVKKRHPKYHKAYTVSKKYKAHDEENQYKTGDKVVIESVRPMSKEKKFKVISWTNAESSAEVRGN